MSCQCESEMEYENYQADFSKTGKEMLIDLLNYSNRKSMATLLTPEMTFFTKPQWVGMNEDMNSRIRFAKVIGFNIPQGSEEIYYNRVDINQVTKLKYFNYNVFLDPNKTYTTTHDLLNDFYRETNIRLIKEDVVEEPIKIDFRNLEKTRVLIEDDVIDRYAENYIYPKVTFTISDESIAYYGQITFQVRPMEIGLNEVMKVTRLKPFIPPLHNGLLS